MIQSRFKFKPGDDAAPIWMISFSDLQAQLVVFFALLLSYSSLDPVRVSQVGAGFRGSTGRQAPPPRDDFIVWWVMSHQVATPGGRAVSPEAWGPEGREFLVTRTKEGLRISLERAITFEAGSAVIRADQVDAVTGFLRFIRGSMNKLDVRGHTSPDEEPQGGDHWQLSIARAQAVADLLMAVREGETGIAPERIRLTGMGKNEPVVDILETRDSFQRQRNRRVEIIVLEEKVKLK